MISAVGVYLLYKLGFFIFRHPIRTLLVARRGLRAPGAVRSFLLALAGTLGVGNVFGVALGLAVGGCGSVFWLLVSTVFSSVIKYAEVTLSFDNARAGHGGMFYCIKNSFAHLGGVMSVIYAVCALLLSFFMGAALQIRTVGDAYGILFDTPPYLFLSILVLLIGISVFFGGKVISKITLLTIPMSTIVYTIITLTMIIMNISRLGDVIFCIVRDAFTVRAGVGGVFGFLFSSSMREGYSRGILSNEAGAGTSSMAHTSSDGAKPAERGVLGLLEVVFDTTLLCTLTAFAILLSVPDVSVFNTGMSLIMYAVDGTLGGFGSALVLLSVLIFAYSTVVCWYFYGCECIRFLFGREVRLLYFPLFILSLVAGACLPVGALVYATDALLLILSALTLPTLIKNSDRICVLSERAGLTRTGLYKSDS